MADEQIIHQEVNESGGADVIPLFLHRKRPTTPAEPRSTVEELAEYRRIKPLLLEMLREWQLTKGPGGCPVLKKVLSKD